jgi:hypothetical protein
VFLAVVLIGGNIALGAEASWAGERRDSFALPATVAALAGMTVSSLPSSVLPPSVEVIRFIGLGVAMLATAVHLVLRWRPAARAEAERAAAPTRRALRVAPQPLLVVGTFALLLSLLMGVMKESARGNYAIYGELTQAQARQHFNPPGSLYP